MEDYEFQFVEINRKLDTLMELLPNWLSSNEIKPPDLIVAPSAQVTSNPVDDLLENYESLDLDESGETPHQSWTESEVHRTDNRYSVGEESMGNIVEPYAYKLFDEMTMSIQEALLEEQMYTKMAQMHSKLNMLLDSSSGDMQPIEMQAIEEQKVTVPCAYHIFDEMTSKSRAKVVDKQLMYPYIGGIDYNNFTLFDPGGGRKYAMSSSGGVVPESFCKAHGTYEKGMEGIDRGKIVMKNDADRVLDEMLHSNSLTLRETFSVVNAAKPLIISDPLITRQESYNEWSDPNVREVNTFILASSMTGYVNGSTNGSTMAWFEKVLSILKVALGKNVMEDNAHGVFDKRSKIRTHADGILLFVYDPGGSLPLPRDCEVLKFDIRYKHTITLHYVFGVPADVPNFSIDWDYTITMSNIISKVIEMCLVQVMQKKVAASGDCPYKHLGMLISAIILKVVSVSSIFFPQSLIRICLVEPNKESYANKYDDRVLLSLHSVKGLRYVKRSCWFTPLSMNNLVPPSPNSVTMVYYGSIVIATCLLVVPGGGYLLLIASRDTLGGKYTRNAKSSVPKAMCVGMVELGSNKACKPLIELLVDYLFLTQEALGLDDDELGHMTFSIVPTMLLPGVIPKIVVVSSDFSIEAGVISILVRKDVRTFRHSYVVADKIKLLYGGELATEMVMSNGVEWNLQTEQDCSFWLEAFSLDITIIHSLAETFFQQRVLKSRPMLLMNVKEERNQLLILNEDFLGQLQLSFYCHSISLFAFHNLSCMIGCFISCGLKHFQQYLNSNGYDGIIVTKLQNYVWDPGQNVIYLYILEDKDVFERVGKWIIQRDHTTRLTVTMPTFMNPRKELFELQVDRDVAFATVRSSYYQRYIFVTTPIKVMLMTSTWLHVWKCHLESITWNPGIVVFPCSSATLPRSYYVVLHCHGVPNAYKKSTVATNIPGEAVQLASNLLILDYIRMIILSNCKKMVGSWLSHSLKNLCAVLFAVGQLENSVPMSAFHKNRTFVHITGKMMGQGQYISSGAALLKSGISEPEFVISPP